MSPALERVRGELADRRERVAGLIERRPDDRLVELLVQVDAALDRLETPDWGLCQACHGTLEPERLSADPLVSICLDCLSPEARRSLERDLESAARVQRALLPPRELAHADWQIAWLWEPKGAVAGDWVDLIAGAGEAAPLHLVLGDVAGKGVAASLLQSHLHALFRALAAPELPLAGLLERANRLFCDATGTASYATLISSRLDRGGRVELATAGHPRPLLADRRGVRPVEGSGLPLGLFCDAAYRPRELWLAPGDTLLLYSDGWTEAARGDGEEYGIGRAAAALGRAVRLPLSDLLAACRDDMESFLDRAPRADDFTLLAIRRLPDGARPTGGRAAAPA